jgi:hypothetical protein
MLIFPTSESASWHNGFVSRGGGGVRGKQWQICRPTSFASRGGGGADVKQRLRARNGKGWQICRSGPAVSSLERSSVDGGKDSPLYVRERDDMA